MSVSRDDRPLLILLGDSWLGAAAEQAFSEALAPLGMRVRAVSFSGQKASQIALQAQNPKTVLAWGAANASAVLLLCGINDARAMPVAEYARCSGSGRPLPMPYGSDCLLLILRSLWHANPRLRVVSFPPPASFAEI